MNILSSFTALVTVALIGIAAESAWSDAATPNESAKPAVQTPAPTTGVAPGWYPPHNRGGYPRSWQQPPQWSVPPQGYGQSPPHYPPRGPYQTVPAVAAVNPLSAEFKQMQKQLTAKSTELETAHAMLEQLRGTLQRSVAAERVLRRKVADITSEQQTLQVRVNELTTALNTTTAMLEQQRQQITNDQEKNRTLTAERDRLRDDLDSRDERLATVQVELQAATQTLQQAQAETGTSGQQLRHARSQAEMVNNKLTELRTQLESQKTTLLNAEQMLAAEIDERDGLHANLAVCKQELTQAQATLTDAQSVEDALRQAPPTAAGVVVPFAPDGPDKAVEPAASEGFDAGIAEVAAPKTTTTDTDEDGVPDSIDLCPETQHGIAVESTGCAAGITINLDGVNFLYNSHELTNEARGILDRIADVIIQQPELRLEVAGHTDATGNPTYNQELSMQRAEAVRDYLVTQGANPRYIGAAGYGGQRPIADNTTPEGLEKNRRVELRVLQ